MSYGPIFQFLVLLLLPVVARLISLFTGISRIMAVARPLFCRSNNQHHQQQQLKVCARTSQLMENERLSELPDDILIYILSLLSMKEAGRTSVLSKRWRHLWEYIPTLNFDSSKIIHDMDLRIRSPEVEGPRYLRWVDQVLSLYKAPTVDEVKLQFDINCLEGYSRSIDNWFVFAMEKKVKRLQVHLLYGGYCLRHTFNCPSSSNSLTSLSLTSVNITGEILESFLCNCQALECLSVKDSETLLGLKVTGKSHNLKTLSINQCSEIKQLEISAPNLVSVLYYGPEINVGFKSTPKLAEVSFGFDYALNLVNGFSDLSGYLSQIEVFSLELVRMWDVSITVEGPVFTNLVKLDMEVTLDWDDKLDFLKSMLKACPILHHFKLQLVLNQPDDELYQPENEIERVIKLEAYPHSHLKVVEIVGFLGCPIDLDIAAFLIESAVSLEKIIVDPRVVLLIESAWEFNETPEKERARVQAMQLGTNLKPGTELQIL